MAHMGPGAILFGPQEKVQAQGSETYTGRYGSCPGLEAQSPQQEPAFLVTVLGIASKVPARDRPSHKSHCTQQASELRRPTRCILMFSEAIHSSPRAQVRHRAQGYWCGCHLARQLIFCAGVVSRAEELQSQLNPSQSHSEKSRLGSILYHLPSNRSTRSKERTQVKFLIQECHAMPC